MAQVDDTDQPKTIQSNDPAFMAYRVTVRAHGSTSEPNFVWAGYATSEEEAARLTKRAAKRVLVTIEYAVSPYQSKRVSLSRSQVLIERVEGNFVPPRSYKLFFNIKSWPHYTTANGRPFFCSTEHPCGRGAHSPATVVRAISKKRARVLIESVIRTDPAVRKALCDDQAVDAKWISAFIPGPGSALDNRVFVALGIWRVHDEARIPISEATAQAVLCIALRSRNLGRRYSYIDDSGALTLRPSNSATLRAAGRIASQHGWLKHRGSIGFLRRIGLSDLALAAIAQANAAAR